MFSGVKYWCKCFISLHKLYAEIQSIADESKYHDTCRYVDLKKRIVKLESQMRGIHSNKNIKTREKK